MVICFLPEIFCFIQLTVLYKTTVIKVRKQQLFNQGSSGTNVLYLDLSRVIWAHM